MTRASSVREPMMICGSASLQSSSAEGTMFGSASAFTIRARNRPPTTAPTNEPRPPPRLAPPRTAAAMLFRAKSEAGPGWAVPIPSDAARNSSASVAIVDERTNALQLTRSA
jgi:hypothetical protein